MQEQLPIDAHLDHLVAEMKSADRGTSGSHWRRENNRVPLAVEQALDGQIIVLQPRRLAARSVAQRMADQTKTTLGDYVGYQVRFEKRISEKTRVIVMTDGLFLRYLQSNPFLEGVHAVIFDEFHERNVHSDLALALCRQVQVELGTTQTRRNVRDS